MCLKPKSRTRPAIITLHRHALTLVEVLVVTAVIGILAAVVTLGVPSARTSAHRTQCASNLRQIGVALLCHAADNAGFLPQTRHTWGSRRDEAKSWIYTLAPYLSDVDAVRVCPADEAERQASILRQNATSYLLNDTVFDPDRLDPDAPRHDNVQWLCNPSQTLLAAISSRPVSATWDHAHCAEWTSWNAMLADVAVDRHRSGTAAANRLRGDANYLYADGRVENIDARDWKRRYFDRGINPGAVPE